MLFNSLEFLFIFLPVSLLAFFVTARISKRMAITSLAIASIGFYSYWDARFLPVLAVSILFNYGMAQVIGRSNKFSRLMLSLAVTCNLSALFFYKYLDFGLSSVNTALDLALPLQHLALPLGISFFTFTQIAYLVDVHRRQADTSSLINYVLFVTYFPHLIAGPILHHGQMMPQFKAPGVFRPDSLAFASGALFLTIGLVKKLLLADELAGYASPVFAVASQAADMGPQEAWVGALAYTLQLYFDFSGYCDMALGISLMFNINLPLNFASPYKATSIIDFWRRWHMTLSQFLRDYLYIALGGNRHGPLRRYLNLFITMLLGGLWHGANWTFVVWGCLHGLFLMINHGFRALRARWGLPAMPALIAGGLTFVAVVFAWVPFRAESLSDAVGLWQAMIPSLNTHDSVSGIRVSKALPWLITGLLIISLMPNSQQIVTRFQALISAKKQHHTLRWGMAGLALGAAFSLTVMNIGHVSEFLYFQF